jgi:hypothetical protein
VSTDAAEMSPDAAEKRQFIVTACQESRRGELVQVEAASHEDAVTSVAASQTLTEGGVVYEVWPAGEPSCILRVTLVPHKPRHQIEEPSST